jgi:hypothetical protein
MADFMGLDIRCLCNSGDADTSDCDRRDRAENGDLPMCGYRRVDKEQGLVFCKAYEPLLSDAEDYLERLFKAHMNKAETAKPNELLGRVFGKSQKVAKN